MVQPLELGQTPPETLMSPEKRLAGKTVIITGGNRDVGLGITNAFVAEGARIVSSFSKPERQPEVAALTEAINSSGGDIAFFRHDFKKPDEREAFAGEALERLGKIDFLILNTSGRDDSVNEGLSTDMLNRILPHMNEGGVVIRMQSVPAKFGPQLEGLDKVSRVYKKVARHKREDLGALRKRVDEMTERGVRFIEVTPTVVMNGTPENPSLTSNLEGFNAITLREAEKEGIENPKNAVEHHDDISEMLGLPLRVYSDEIGRKIVDIILDPNIPTGHTEFFNGVEDAQTRLETFYGTDQVYVQTLQRMTPEEKEKTGYVAIARSIVSKEQVQRGLEEMIDPFQPYWADVFVQHVRDGHAVGHFRKENKFPAILPGHKQIRAAVEVVGFLEKKTGNSPEVRLAGISGVRFRKPVEADRDRILGINPKVSMRTENNAHYNVQVDLAPGKVTADIQGLEVRCMDNAYPNTLLEDQLIEGAAQAAGIALLPNVDGQVMPFFLEIGKTEFTGIMVKAGAGLEYRVKGKGNRRMINGDVEIYSDGVKVGEVTGIKATVVPRDKIEDLLSS